MRASVFVFRVEGTLDSLHCRLVLCFKYGILPQLDIPNDITLLTREDKYNLKAGDVYTIVMYDLNMPHGRAKNRIKSVASALGKMLDSGCMRPVFDLAECCTTLMILCIRRASH